MPFKTHGAGCSSYMIATRGTTARCSPDTISFMPRSVVRISWHFPAQEMEVQGEALHPSVQNETGKWSIPPPVSMSPISSDSFSFSPFQRNGSSHSPGGPSIKTQTKQRIRAQKMESQLAQSVCFLESDLVCLNFQSVFGKRVSKTA